MITEGRRPLPSDPVARHLDRCESCQREKESLREIWTLLGQWPEVSPSAGIEARLTRQIRRLMFGEAVLTVRGWTPAVLAAAIGVGLSLVLSFLVPYSQLIRLCQEALRSLAPNSVHYLVAGMVYGLPVALGAMFIMRRSRESVLIKSLEASLLFLLIIAPYVIAQCREFPLFVQITFLSGMGIGAWLPTVGGTWVLGRFLSPRTST